MPDPKQWVKRTYAALAQGCTSTWCCGGAAAGYRPEELATAPAAAQLSLGCGNPVALAGIRAGEVVLDLGCGAGLDVFLASHRVGPQGRVIGVDLTPEMVERARASAAAAGLQNVEFRLGDAEAIPAEDGSVDLVISNCVLNLVPDKHKAFREIARVLKPGGRIAISDLVLDGPLPPELQGSEEAYTACLSGALSREEYLGGLAAAGLEDLRVVSEADAAALFSGSCCGGGGSLSVPQGVVTSIHVTGRKPTRDGGTGSGDC